MLRLVEMTNKSEACNLLNQPRKTGKINSSMIFLEKDVVVRKEMSNFAFQICELFVNLGARHC